jgi:peptide/nickel transport system substrate-binding protein
VEPATVALHTLRNTGVTDYLTKRIFNASLGYLDPRGNVHPYLAKTVPQLNTESWRLYDDGTMETTYQLDPRGVWHDGRPLTADDFVFAWQVSRSAELGQTDAAPMNLMTEVTATDPHTLVIRWNRIYADAAHLSMHNSELAALPRHMLEEPLRTGSAESFLGHPFWTRDYVGLGPFRIERWEAGAFIEAAAFDGNVLGRPKIDRIRMVFIGDGNTVLSNILAGEVHMSGDGALRVEQAITLQQEWAPRNGGSVVMQPNQWRAVNFQMREELATPRLLLDPRARRAFAHATDKQSINDALYSGLERVADFVLPPLSDVGLA